MEINNYFYINDESDLELLFQLIHHNYLAMKKDQKLAEMNKFKDEAIGNIHVKIDWSMNFFLMPGNEIKIIETDQDKQDENDENSISKG